MAGFVSPLIEAFGFISILLAVVAIFRLIPDIGVATIYVVTCGVAGWYLHGANLATIGQALCFSALAAFTFLVYSRFGLLSAAGLNLLTHVVWNFGGVALFLWAKLR